MYWVYIFFSLYTHRFMICIFSPLVFNLMMKKKREREVISVRAIKCERTSFRRSLTIFIYTTEEEKSRGKGFNFFSLCCLRFFYVQYFQMFHLSEHYRMYSTCCGISETCWWLRNVLFALFVVSKTLSTEFVSAVEIPITHFFFYSLALLVSWLTKSYWIIYLSEEGK